MVESRARKLAQKLRRFGKAAVFPERPLSTVSGFDRGTPVDRYYIERFLAGRANDIVGRVLEVGGDEYSRRYGGTRVTRQDILHIDASNRAATFVGDLSTPGVLPPRTFDCIVLTQVLQYCFDVPAALDQVQAALRPGGVLLLTVPGVAPVSLDDWQQSYYWRFTAPAVERLLNDRFGSESVEVRACGNFYAATAFIHGASVEELDRAKLDREMPEYAIVITARAVA